MANYYCEYCGKAYSTVKDLLNGSCSKHPLGCNKGKHKLYEGGDKAQYTCKYCGKTYKTIKDMVIGSCSKHPDGCNKGKHAPSMV